ncbi:MAG: T9SS type A sorting domain-containing protein [Paludibacter sp.]|nr:T9SS type A sorting domain-containing protein [Paludibacter sp.]MDD4199017.1 T9SS type A sorting domain-containing protein [Paludibacter sp.]MDD4427130.1 T9SS type A sorting domain-containing protein [Paludibacter sp.]
MKQVIMTIAFFLLLMPVHSQTVIRMRMPQQSEQALEVVTLFSEALPVGIPVVLGVIGFDITGGTTPYLLEWLRNDTVVATGEVAVVTPKVGSTYMLRVSDKAGCFMEQALQLDTRSKVKANYLEDIVKVSPTVISNELIVRVNSYFPLDARIRVFDTNGKLCFDQRLQGDFTTAINWDNGIYYVVISAGELHQVTKVIVSK